MNRRVIKRHQSTPKPPPSRWRPTSGRLVHCANDARDSGPPTRESLARSRRTRCRREPEPRWHSPPAKNEMPSARPASGCERAMSPGAGGSEAPGTAGRSPSSAAADRARRARRGRCGAGSAGRAPAAARGSPAAPGTRRTASPPRALIASMRAAVIGSPGEANGSLSMMTQLSASPTTSTPCQKLDVASSTALRRRRGTRASSAERGAVPCTRIG